MPKETEYSLELVKIDFTQDELIELGLKVAEQVQELKIIDRQKKSAAAGFLAREKRRILKLMSLPESWKMAFKCVARIAGSSMTILRIWCISFWSMMRAISLSNSGK